MHSILLAEPLEALVRTKRRSESFLFVPKELALVLNAIGGYILAQANAQKMVERMQEANKLKEGSKGPQSICQMGTGYT